MFNATVTVFNRYYSKQLDKYTWYPHVIHNCYFNADKAANIEKTGLVDADSATLHIPFSFEDGKTMILYQSDGNMIVLFGCVYTNEKNKTFYYGDSYVFDENGVFVEYIGDVGQDFGDWIESTYFSNNPQAYSNMSDDFGSNDTERVREVAKRTAHCTYCQRRLTAKFEFLKSATTKAKLRFCAAWLFYITGS